MDKFRQVPVIWASPQIRSSVEPTKERILTTPTLGTGRRLSALRPFHRAKLVFLVAAFLSFLFSVYLWFFVDREIGLFVGLWVPAIHSLGTLVLVGEDR